MRGDRLTSPLLLIAAYVAVFATGLVWIGSAELAALKRQLAAVTPLALHLTLLLLVGGAVASRKPLLRSLQGCGLAPWVLAGAALVAVSTLPPRTHRIYYDEDIYENVAQNILWRERAEMCNEGVVEYGTFECRAAEYNKEPNGFPFLLSLVFRFTGVRETAAHVANHFLFALGVVSCCWVAWLLFQDRLVAVGAGLIYLLTPENLLWGATAAVEPGSAAFTGLALGAWVLYLMEGGGPLRFFAAGVVAFSVQWRPESLLTLGVLGGATLLFRPDRLKQKHLYVTALLVLVLLVPHAAHLWAVRGERWGSADGGRFAFEHVLHNLRTNAAFYVEGREHPLYFTLLALLGALARGRWKDKVTLLLWFGAFFSIFLPFHAGSYRYGADVRFSLLSFMPLSILAGLGAAWAAEALAKRIGRSPWIRALPLAAAVYAFAGYLPLVRSVGREAWAARADHDMAHDMLEEVPEGSMVLTHNPGMLQVMGQSAAQASTATYQPAKVDGYFREFPGGVYFHFNFWCNISDPVQNGFCNAILKAYPTRVVTERSAGFYRYVLYRLAPKR